MSSWKEETILKCKWHGDESEAFHIAKEMDERFAAEPHQGWWQCPVCGYDTTNAEIQTCPSCGEKMRYFNEV